YWQHDSARGDSWSSPLATMSVLVEARSWRRNVPRNGGPDGQRIRESVVVARATTRHLMRPTETDHARHEIGSDPESMWLRREARDFAHVDLARGVPRIVSGLHAQPHVGTIPESRAEADRDLGRDRLALAQNVIQVLAGNAERIRDRRLGQLQRRQDVFAQQRTGMGRAALLIPFCDDFGHSGLQLVILLQVHTQRIPAFKLEGEAPG